MYVERHCGVCRRPGHNRRTCSSVPRPKPVPVRKALGERLVDGEIHQVLECGHTVAATLDKDGNWVQERRQCHECQAGAPACKPLYEGEPTYDFRRKAWQRLRMVEERPVRGSAFQARA